MAEDRPPAPSMVDAPSADGEPPLTWHDIGALGVEGQGWRDTAHPYDRLPARARDRVPEAVWALSQHSAGLCVRFLTDAPSIHVRWTPRLERLATTHMPATGVSGLDLYGRDDAGRWRFAGVARPPEDVPTHQGPLTTCLAANLAPTHDAKPREYRLHLPLYNGVHDVHLGIPAEHAIAPAPRYPDPRPICFYGTSINQGASASRPGMAHIAILGRRLDRPVLNLGFSGNARCEPALAELLAELNPALYVLDPVPNMTADLVRERLGAFVTTLRRARPTTPIVLVENIVYQQSTFDQARRHRRETSSAAVRETRDRLREQHMSGLHDVPGERLLGEDMDATVDGTHPNDLGFARMADALEGVLRGILDA